jgi:uncharacterized membrane protein
MSANKSITERIFQAIGFELLAILICTPLLAWIMDKPIRSDAQAPGHCP